MNTISIISLCLGLIIILAIISRHKLLLLLMRP